MIESLGIFFKPGIKNLGTITNSKNLTELDLSNNLICELEDKVFDELANLELLDLTDNKLKKKWRIV